MAGDPCACGSPEGHTLHSVTCQAARVSSVAGGAPQAALPPRHQSAGSEAQGLGPGNGVWPEAFTPLPWRLSLSPELVPSFQCPPPWGRSHIPGPLCQGGLHAMLPGAQRTGPSLTGCPISPHFGAAPRQGDIQQIPAVPEQREALQQQQVTHSLVPAGALPASTGRGSPGTGGSRRKRGGERQHIVNGSSDRLRSPSSSFSPCYGLIISARQ